MLTGTYDDVKRLIPELNPRTHNMYDGKIRTFIFNQDDEHYYKKFGYLSVNKSDARYFHRTHHRNEHNYVITQLYNQRNDIILCIRHNARVVSMYLGDDRFRDIIPKQVESFVDWSRVDGSKRHYWWRAMSAAYLMRPNKRTQAFIKRHSSKGD